MYHKIKNPMTNRWVNIHSNLGYNIIEKYLLNVSNNHCGGRKITISDQNVPIKSSLIYKISIYNNQQTNGISDWSLLVDFNNSNNTLKIIGKFYDKKNNNIIDSNLIGDMWCLSKETNQLIADGEFKNRVIEAIKHLNKDMDNIPDCNIGVIKGDFKISFVPLSDRSLLRFVPDNNSESGCSIKLARRDEDGNSIYIENIGIFPDQNEILENFLNLAQNLTEDNCWINKDTKEPIIVLNY